MRTVLYSTTADRAGPFAAALQEAGYSPRVCVVERTSPAADVSASLDCPIVFVDLALDLPIIVELLGRLRTVDRHLPPLLALLGEPDDSNVDALVAAGANMYYPAEPAKLSLRLRFLRPALERRSDSSRLLEALAAARQHAARLEREHRDMLARAPNAIAIYRDGRYIWCNEAFTALAGYDHPSELVGTSILDSVAPQLVPTILERLRTREEGGKPPPIEIPLRRRDGSTIQVLAIGMPVMFDGAPALMGFLTDLSDQRRLEMRLVAMERMAALGRLAASVGHEINNPLTYVMGNLQLAMRTPALSPAMMSQLEDALEGAERVRKIVEDLRVFSQRDHEQLAAVDVGAVIDSCARMTKAEVQQCAQLVVEIDGTPQARATTARLAQVITNLVLNAAQAIPRGNAEAHAITIRAASTAEGVVITVADTGAGIAARDLPYVFDPFFSTKRETGGTGLGLSICKMLVAQQGGEITIDSKPGEGTRVTVLLPAAESTVEPKGNDAPVRPERVRRRVLIIDDERQVAESLGGLLDDHDVTITVSGREALAQIGSAAPFDAILCDLMMPDLSGIELYKLLRSDSPGLAERIVFITGGAFSAATAGFVASLPNKCLHKPFTVGELEEAIEAVVGGRSVQ